MSNDLQFASAHVQALCDNARGKCSTCAVQNVPEDVALYLDSWVLPYLESIAEELRRSKYG
jgi:hypothetical protein